MANETYNSSYQKAISYYSSLKTKFIDDVSAEMARKKQESLAQIREEVKKEFDSLTNIISNDDLEERAAKVIENNLEELTNALVDTIDTSQNKLNQVLSRQQGDALKKKVNHNKQTITVMDEIQKYVYASKQKAIAAEFLEDKLTTLRGMGSGSKNFDYGLTKQILVSQAVKRAKNNEAAFKPTKPMIRTIAGDIREGDVLGLIEKALSLQHVDGGPIARASGLATKQSSNGKNVQTKMDIVLDLFNLFASELSGETSFPSDVDNYFDTLNNNLKRQDDRLDKLYGVSVKKWLLKDLGGKNPGFGSGFSMGNYPLRIDMNSGEPYLMNLNAAAANTINIIGARNVLFATGNNISWTDNFIKTFRNKNLYLQRATRNGAEYYIPHKGNHIELNINKWEFYSKK